MNQMPQSRPDPRDTITQMFSGRVQSFSQIELGRQIRLLDARAAVERAERDRRADGAYRRR